MADDKLQVSIKGKVIMNAPTTPDAIIGVGLSLIVGAVPEGGTLKDRLMREIEDHIQSTIGEGK